MTINDFFGFMFFIILLISATISVFSKNTIYAVLSLIGCFLVASSILFLYKCEFVPFLFIVVYVGAIAVLFLFVVMMLETKIKSVEKTKIKYIPTGFYIGFFFLISSLINNFDYWFKMRNPYYNSFKYNEYTNWVTKIDLLLEIETIGCVLYTYYIVFFLISGFLLFLAVLGSVSLTTNFKRKQNLSKLANQF
jgi:NADH:ubiquinone oxidoreductase subunit 6 (subunit J)